MRQIIMIIPFYGDVPNYFPAFVYSASKLKGFVDFLLVSDDSFCTSVQDYLPNNFIQLRMQWDKLLEHINNRVHSKPFSPYKLCDYKPLYGYIFRDYIMEYEYWGYCDVDTLLGDIKHYLLQYNYKQYDRFGAKGHFTIYRNSDEINSLWKVIPASNVRYHDFRNVCKTTYPCHFDEDGMNVICKEQNVSFLERQFELNTVFETTYLHTYKYRTCPQILTWEKGKAFSYVIEDNGVLKKEEGMYIHFQSIKNMPVKSVLSDSMIITHEGIFSFSVDNLYEYFSKYGCVESEHQRMENLHKLEKKMRKDRLVKFKREFETIGFSALINVFYRLKNIPNLIREHTL